MKLIDIHTHGGFGIDFNSADDAQIKHFAREIKKHGIVAFCPTLATDTLENINAQLAQIKHAMEAQEADEAKILGAHLEALFLNPEKKGIHPEKMLLAPSVENFKKLKHTEIVKIVTMALELDEGLKLRDYLITQNIKVQLGHTKACELFGAHATTHHFNAMPALQHRESNATLKALLDEDIYCEIIADTKHVNPDMLKLFFKTKSHDRILLVSDSLAIAHSELSEFSFCNTTILPGGLNKEGTLGGGVMFLGEIIEQLDTLGILSKEQSLKMAWDNVLNYLGVHL